MLAPKRRQSARPHQGQPAFWSVCALVVVLSGCVQEMANQNRIEVYEQSRFFADGIGSRKPVEGTIAQGDLIEDQVFATGTENGAPVAEIPVEITTEVLSRGQTKYKIFCSHCHGMSGDGDGMVVQRGFPAPPSYHIDRLRTVPDGHIYKVITEGIARMPAFGTRIAPADRWAITAYVRALQLSQNAKIDQLSDEDNSALNQAAASPETTPQQSHTPEDEQ